MSTLLGLGVCVAFVIASYRAFAKPQVKQQPAPGREYKVADDYLQEQRTKERFILDPGKQTHFTYERFYRAKEIEQKIFDADSAVKYLEAGGQIFITRNVTDTDNLLYVCEPNDPTSTLILKHLKVQKSILEDEFTKI